MKVGLIRVVMIQKWDGDPDFSLQFRLKIKTAQRQMTAGYELNLYNQFR